MKIVPGALGRYDASLFVVIAVKPRRSPGEPRRTLELYSTRHRWFQITNEDEIIDDLRCKPVSP